MSALYTALKQNFDGLSAGSGLLNPVLHLNPTGDGKLGLRQIWRPKLIVFANPGLEPATISIRLVNPVTLNEFEIDGGIVDAGMSASYGGPQGFAELGTSVDGLPWLLKCVSTGADSVCEFSVHYDFGRTLNFDPAGKP